MEWSTEIFTLGRQIFTFGHQIFTLGREIFTPSLRRISISLEPPARDPRWSSAILFKCKDLTIQNFTFGGGGETVDLLFFSEEISSSPLFRHPPNCKDLTVQIFTSYCFTRDPPVETYRPDRIHPLTKSLHLVKKCKKIGKSIALSRRDKSPHRAPFPPTDPTAPHRTAGTSGRYLPIPEVPAVGPP